MAKTKNLFNTQRQVVLSRSEKQDYLVFMEVINAETEQKLDRQMKLRDSFTYVNLHGNKVPSSSVYLYGEIDLNNKADIKYLTRYKNAILNPYDTGNWYYTTFDYETGDIKYDENRKAFVGTNFVSDFIKWFKFKYCIIGKPQRVIIYKYPIPRRLE